MYIDSVFIYVIFFKMDFLKKLRTEEAVIMKKQLNCHETTACDVMIKPIFLYENDDIETITNKLKKENNNYCIVIDENNKFLWEVTVESLIKIIAHSSINEPLVKILDIGYKRWINFTSTKDYIKIHKNTVHKDANLLKIMKLIDKEGFQYIPVIDKEKKVVGIITPSSILRFVINR